MTCRRLCTGWRTSLGRGAEVRADVKPEANLDLKRSCVGRPHLDMKSVFLPLALLVLGGSCYAEPFRIVASGDSITSGWVPNPSPPSTRYDFDDRWPGASIASELNSLENNERSLPYFFRSTLSHG
jgi:hypothetical protein